MDDKGQPVVSRSSSPSPRLSRKWSRPRLRRGHPPLRGHRGRRPAPPPTASPPPATPRRPLPPREPSPARPRATRKPRRPAGAAKAAAAKESSLSSRRLRRRSFLVMSISLDRRLEVTQAANTGTPPTTQELDRARCLRVESRTGFRSRPRRRVRCRRPPGEIEPGRALWLMKPQTSS